jgi:hypothetical protein
MAERQRWVGLTSIGGDIDFPEDLEPVAFPGNFFYVHGNCSIYGKKNNISAA